MEFLDWRGLLIFFVSLVNHFGSFIYIDDCTASGGSLDVAMIQVCVDFNSVIQDSLKVLVDGKSFWLVIKEEYLTLSVYAQICSFPF